jgi:hypothetical protein
MQSSRSLSRVLLDLSLVVLLLSVVVLAQGSDDEQLQQANQKLRQQVAVKDYDGAIETVSRMLGIAGKSATKANIGQMLYVRACLNALAGHKTPAIVDSELAVKAGHDDYYQFASDSDLDSLRTARRFRALIAMLKQRNGPQILTWESAPPAAAFPLRFDDASADLYRTLRQEFAIDPVVAKAKNDHTKLEAIAVWTSAQWQHSPNQMANSRDPIGVLREARAGGRFICTDYAIVLAGVARAFGMKARVVNLLPRDVETRSEAHTLAEVWLPRWQKWVLADGQYGIIPEKDGVPLNAVELQAALVRDEPVKCRGNINRCREWKSFILRNLYYFKMADDQRSFHASTERQLVLVPKGAASPRKFAGGNEEIYKGAVYTSNPGIFYAAPQ